MNSSIVGFLQYGALGLLALVLVAIGVWFRDYSKKQQEITCEQQKFIRDLAKRALETQDEHLNQWREMTQRAVTSQEGLTRMLVEITKTLERLSQEHLQINARLK